MLTELGANLLPHIYEILGRVEYIRQETAAQRGLAVGKLRIGSIPSMSARLLTHLVSTYQHRYPGIEVVVFEGTEPEIMTMLQRGIVDVGLMAHADESLTAVQIARDEVQLVVSEKHPLAGRNSITIPELAGEPFIMSRLGCGGFIRHQFDEQDVPVKVALEISDGNTVLAMVREGLGVTAMPKMSLPEPLIHLHALSFDPPQYRNLKAAVNSGRTVSPATRAFIELASTHAVHS
jgi:DNA-binding transcriptional LysR family regulator